MYAANVQVARLHMVQKRDTPKLSVKYVNADNLQGARMHKEELRNTPNNVHHIQYINAANFQVHDAHAQGAAERHIKRFRPGARTGQTFRWRACTRNSRETHQTLMLGFVHAANFQVEPMRNKKARDKANLVHADFLFKINLLFKRHF